ncbi:MAG: aminodeoxychorismate lyase [Endozoicomonas sp.]
MTGATVWINGQSQSEVSVLDRGLVYGDGLFETIRISNGRTTLTALHWERLLEDCRRLNIPLDQDEFIEEVRGFLSFFSVDAGVLKVLVTRGVGGRGYNPEGCQNTQRILSIHPLPVRNPDPSISGARVIVCKLRLGQSDLAGMKHLNRLEQVVARSEWLGNIYDEGLLCDFSGNLIEGTMSNLFIVGHNGELITPDLSFSGVKGVCRQYVLGIARKMRLTVKEQCIPENSLQEMAAEVFLCNSVNGIWPVTAYKSEENQENWEIGPLTTKIRDRVQEELNA